MRELGDVQDEKIRGALTHFKDAEFFGKLSSSNSITTVVRSLVSKTLHLSISKEGILFVGQISHESQIRSHMPRSMFEEYKFAPSKNRGVVNVLLETRVFHDCLTLSSSLPPSTHKPQNKGRITSEHFPGRIASEHFPGRIANEHFPDGEGVDEYTSLSAMGGLNERNDDVATWLIITKNAGSVVVIQKSVSVVLCHLSPLHSDEIPVDFVETFNSSSLCSRVIIKSEWLYEALCDLEAVSSKISMEVSEGGASFKLRSIGTSSKLLVEYPEKNGVFEMVSNSRNVSNTYSASSLRHSYPALRLSSKTCLKYNSSDALNMQFILSSGGDSTLFAELIVFAII